MLFIKGAGTDASVGTQSFLIGSALFLDREQSQRNTFFWHIFYTHNLAHPLFILPGACLTVLFFCWWMIEGVTNVHRGEKTIDQHDFQCILQISFTYNDKRHTIVAPRSVCFLVSDCASGGRRWNEEWWGKSACFRRLPLKSYKTGAGVFWHVSWSEIGQKPQSRQLQTLSEVRRWGKTGQRTAAIYHCQEDRGLPRHCLWAPFNP